MSWSSMPRDSGLGTNPEPRFPVHRTLDCGPMKMRAATLLVCTVSAITVARAQMTTLPPWAYGYITLPATPCDYTMKGQGQRADPCDRPGGLPTDPNNTARTLEGSNR